MRILIRTNTRRELRLTYVALVKILREHHLAPPTYKCFKCRLYSQVRFGWPLVFHTKLPCPKRFKHPERATKTCPMPTPETR